MHIGEFAQVRAGAPSRQVAQRQVNHHGRRPGPQLGEPLGRRRRGAHKLVEQNARVKIGDHRARRLDALAVCQHDGFRRAAFDRDALHRRIELYLAAGRFDRAAHGGDDGVGAALTERHAEDLIGHRFQIGKQRAAGDVRREIKVHAPDRQHGLELVVLEIRVDPLARRGSE